MELRELTDYALEKYGVAEEHKWADFPGFSVLVHPKTGKWAALLMRQWDSETGQEIQWCDIKCGQLHPWDRPGGYITAPLRMKGSKWVGVDLSRAEDSSEVFDLFDRAIREGSRQSFTISLGSRSSGDYHDTPIPFAGSTYTPPREQVPDRLRQMRKLYEYGRESQEQKAKNFYTQGKYMEDYEDNAHWEGDFSCYYPTYQDMTVSQLRGYFGWRTGVRQGRWERIPASAAYIYIYELLNGIGAASPRDALEKLGEFEKNYLGAGFGGVRMGQNLRRWALELCVVRELPAELARPWLGEETARREEMLLILLEPGERSDREIFDALCHFSGDRLRSSPVMNEPERGAGLFASAWRQGGEELFARCFGKRAPRTWYPLLNAVYYAPEKHRDCTYALSPCRIYRCSRGQWSLEKYDELTVGKKLLTGFLHEADALFRRYLKTGRYLKERQEDAWAAPIIEAAVRADMREQLERSRPKLEIDLSGLDRIRRDAGITRDSLLTEDEIEDFEPEETPEETPEPLLGELETRVLRALLEGQDPGGMIREAHAMPSVVAESINEALFDALGDTAVDCVDDTLSLVEDYAEDIEMFMGGRI